MDEIQVVSILNAFSWGCRYFSPGVQLLSQCAGAGVIIAIEQNEDRVILSSQ
jgi:hypothetical protein